MNTQCQSYQSNNETVSQQALFLSRQQVLTRYGIGNTTLYRWINDDSVNFPKPVQMGPRCVRWSISRLEQWEQERQEEAA